MKEFRFGSWDNYRCDTFKFQSNIANHLAVHPDMCFPEQKVCSEKKEPSSSVNTRVIISLLWGEKSEIKSFKAAEKKKNKVRK